MHRRYVVRVVADDTHEKQASVDRRQAMMPLQDALDEAHRE
jgi:hypothetical protein